MESVYAGNSLSMMKFVTQMTAIIWTFDIMFLIRLMNHISSRWYGRTLKLFYEAFLYVST